MNDHRLGRATHGCAFFGQPDTVGITASKTNPARQSRIVVGNLVGWLRRDQTSSKQLNNAQDQVKSLPDLLDGITID
jgi:hypothetical protein